MNIKDRASAIRRLLEDESFQWLFESVKQRQVNVFTTVSSTEEQREQAHAKLRALSEIEILISSVYTDERMYDKNQLN